MLLTMALQLVDVGSGLCMTGLSARYCRDGMIANVVNETTIMGLPLKQILDKVAIISWSALLSGARITQIAKHVFI